jgi:hypothetical protein
MQQRTAIWGMFAAFLLLIWLLIAIWAIQGGTEKKKGPLGDFDSPFKFDDFQGHPPIPPDEP